MSSRLPVHEWLAIIAISGLLLGIITISILTRDASLPTELGPPHYVMPQEIEVFVEGAVRNPGPLQARRGMRVRDVLDLAELIDSADIRRLRLDSKVRNGQVIKVPAYVMITVNVEGAVEEAGEITLRKGSTLEDLIPLIKFQKDANIEKLRRKRRLKPGETIVVK